ncbi:hypothetical protein TKK_0002749 [Trichogramma kaykai]
MVLTGGEANDGNLAPKFCVGDRFYLCENKILCEYDYEERLVFANMALHPPASATLAHIKRQVTQQLQPPQVRFKQCGIEYLKDMEAHLLLVKMCLRYNKSYEKSKMFNTCLNITYVGPAKYVFIDQL